MSKHKSHGPAHFVTGMAVVAAAGCSTIIMTYSISKSSLPSPVLECAMVAVSVLTASLALMPMFLAPAYGDAIRAGKARRTLLVLTLMVLAVDGAMQMNAINVVTHAMGAEASILLHVIAAVLVASFQLATFFIRGALIEAHHERQAQIQADKLAVEQETTKREKNKKRNAQRRAKKAAEKRAELQLLQGGRA